MILSAIGQSVIRPLTIEEFNCWTIDYQNQETIIDDQLWVLDAGCQVSVLGDD
jgi:hypothetical protein